ncbi:hypothetical protein CVIRNUC_005952 [Coccomyxa viridis]|uniref:Flavin-containing monooxygenase n=1 Tax=Coccomyxa viridis TaxID=1274662 RepID=A0AAV1I963_9CHLO|nr:hypothetical protein CVIRNUC_005952 [Coccomyxa viridis]
MMERGFDIGKQYKGELSMAGKDQGKDCSVGTQDLSGKDVVVLGSGAFACEAMEAALTNGAKHVTMICRDRKRWILPFNRELTLGALAQAPLIPWRWKMDATHWWLKRYFYGPAGIVHMMPGAGNKAAPRDNDYAGQSNDGIFKFARAGRVTCKVDRIKEVRERSLVLTTGEEVPADLIVFAYGLKYQAEPECLKELGIGFKDLHSFAFLGPSGRIGTAQDGLFAYVPAGPHKQFDMFLHSYQCYKRGLLQDFQEDAMEPTPIPQTSYEALGAGSHRSAWGTWFETAGKYSVMNSTYEWRQMCYYKVMAFGRTPMGRLGLRLQLLLADLFQWIALICLGVLEFLKEPRPLSLRSAPLRAKVS